MKTYLFILMAGCVAIFSAYVVGVIVGRERCRADIVQNTGMVQSQTIKIMEGINAETFNTGVGDIRRILYEKYTIAE